MHLTGWNPNITLDLSLLDNRIIIDYVTNRTYILTASKRQQIQVNYLLQSKMRFLYDMMVNYFKIEILSFQSCTNLLRLSSLKGWVRSSAFSADGFLIPTPQLRYRYDRYSNHKLYFNNSRYECKTSLSKRIWNFKKEESAIKI